MKAEINNENKEKFFAQYWGQDIIHHDDIQYTGYYNSVDEQHMYDSGVDGYCLVLKPLSLISDEDANVLGFLCKEIFLNYNNRTGILSTFQTDYLRSKGYALPWVGLSVEEMVESGWIKLIEI